MTPTPQASPDEADRAGDWLRSVPAPGAELSLDSRRLRPGDGFIAVPGAADDGRRHVGQAVANGAAAIVYDPAGGVHPSSALPMRALEGLRATSGRVAARYYGRPSSRLRVVAVTGTNGKTSCTQWIARGLASMGERAGVVGTLGSGIVDAAPDASFAGLGLTTPDAVSLQRLFAEFARRGVRTVAVEASSIGLDQQRLAGTDIEVAVFTNVSRDHLDYHGDMASYVAAKRRLFAWPGLRAAVINADDPHGATMLEAFGDREEAIVYGERPLDVVAQRARRIEALAVDERGDGLSVEVDGALGHARFDLRLLGRFNAINAIAVAGAWIALGVDRSEVLARIGALEPVPGRMQRVGDEGGPLVVVDYAHTPDALQKTLAALAPVARARGGRLVCVFGAGGDRDRGKRPLMAGIAERLADRVVVTSDNPRGEAPEAIAADICAGMHDAPWLLELDRAAAIGRVIAQADARDLVLVAGKGHEDYQEIGGVRHPFSDVEVARGALRDREAA